MRVILRLPDDWDLDVIGAAVGAGFHADRPRTVRVRYLDTFDWRIVAAGSRLTDELADDGRALRWIDDSGEPPHILPVRRTVRFARELPESILRSHLEAVAGIRAILPVGESRVDRWIGRLRDPNGNTVLLLHLERAAVLDGSGDETGTAVSTAELLAIAGFEESFEEVVSRLRELQVDGDCPDVMELAAAARGLRVGGYSSKLDLTIDSRERADEALRAILRHLAGTLRANVDGIIADYDTEFLHDFRVATRRTRAALAQLKGVLPAEAVAIFRGEFRWLGELTGPCRDLDVYLLEMDTFRGMLGSLSDSVDPLQRVVERERRKALREVRSGLRSARFRRLLNRWDAFLDAPTPTDSPPPKADVPIHELASRKILKAFRRMTKRGRGLGEDPPADALHRLRIEAKKLRYLLEFFSSLYDEREIARMVKWLKQLQDILGGINDLRVQRDRLVEFARELAANGEVEAVLALGQLMAALDQKQAELRHHCAEAFDVFAGPASRARYASLFSDGGSS